MSLKDKRLEVATDLNDAGITAYAVVPSKVSPPAVIVEQANPYVEEDETFSTTTMKMNLDLYALVPTAQVDTMTDALDDLIEEVIFNLGEWTVGGVSLVFYETGGARFLAARIPINTTFEIGGSL